MSSWVIAPKPLHGLHSCIDNAMFSNSLVSQIRLFRKETLMSTQRVYLVLLLIGISGCTTYGEMGVTGGVQALQVNETTWEINAVGNAYSNELRMRDFLLLRASEIALENGFTHFIPSEASTSSTERLIGTPGQVETSAACSGRGCAASSAVTGPIYNTYRFPEGRLRAVFVRITDGATTPADAISASLVYKQLAPVYLGSKARQVDR